MLSPQQERYALARSEGLAQKAAALAAGCPPASASVQATRYERKAHVVARMIELGVDVEAVPARPKQSAEQVADKIAVSADVPRETFDCPLKFMSHIMNSEAEDPKLRLDAAKAIASFTVAKPGEKGKKEERKDAAEKVAGTGRFGVSKAPLRVIK